MDLKAGKVLCGVLSAAHSPSLSAKQRKEIESKLKNYDIPVQILEMVVKESNCNIDLPARNGKTLKRNYLDQLLPKIDDRSVTMLQQIFLECHDSFSHFRFAVYLSSMYHAVGYKFVINQNVDGSPYDKHFMDVCTYSRESGSLVAVGRQNDDERSRPAGNDSIRAFLTAVDAICAVHPTLRGAYYASSYGYDAEQQSLREFWSAKKKQNKIQARELPLDLRFFEYKDKVYFETKSIGLS